VTSRGLAGVGGSFRRPSAGSTPLGIYEPPWRYPPKELAIDLSYHLVYGLGVAGTYRLLEQR